MKRSTSILFLAAVALRHQFVSQYPYWYRANDIPFLKTFYAN